MSPTQPLLLRFGDFELDEANARLTHRSRALELAPRAFAVLCALARHPGQLVTKDALLDAVWGHRHVSESVLKAAVSQLRAALADDAKQPTIIETASRRGYRFIAPTRPGQGRTAPASIASRMPALAPMTGREASLERLHAAWGRACAGQRQLCWLAGEAGIGKTTLVDHFAASLGAIAFAQGHCVEQHGPGEPYLPVLEALATLCRDDPALVASLRTVAPTWLLQLPWLCSETEREGLRRELAGTSPERMLREFGELLDRCTQERPLLLVTEDLHWSDHATVNLLNHVARRRGAARWMWLVTFRVAEVIAQDHPVKALRHELKLHRLCEEILLDAFSEQELAQYVNQRLDGSAWPEAFVKALHRHTDGLPLFVANLVDDLLARGALQSDAADAQAAFDALSVPESLAGVMEKQILRLPADQAALLEAASACGLEFRPAVVAEVMERDIAWVTAQCDLLARQQQWLLPAQVERGTNGELQGRHAFRHALVRHVFYDRMGAMTRARLHHRVAVALEHAAAAGIAVSSAEFATQFELGQDPDGALPHHVAAVAGALQQFAPADALRLADRGLAIAAQCRAGASLEEQRATLHTLRGASVVQVMGVSADETLQAFEQARAAMEHWPRHPLRSMALHGLGLGLFLRGGPREARELAERSLAQAVQRQDPVMVVTACDLLGQMTKLEGPPDEAVAVLEQGIEAAAALDEPTLQAAFVLDPLVNMRAALAIPLLLAGRDRQSRMQSDLALARARELKQPMARMIATWLAMLCELRRDNREPIAAMARELRAITDEGALAQGEGPSQWFLGLAQAWSGQPVEGHAQIEQAYSRYAQVGMLYGSSEVLGYATDASILAGDWDGARRHADEGLELSTRLHDNSYRVQLLLMRRRIALAQGVTQEADEAGRHALVEARRQRSPWLEMTALVELCDGSRPRAEDLRALRDVIARMPEPSDAPLMERANRLARRLQP
ncbi:MAG TPA: AAA family ATPase [Burkholderiales bacterium]|nr:AAA family ATPase [Burkholderiales bacterium]